MQNKQIPNDKREAGTNKANPIHTEQQLTLLASSSASAPVSTKTVLVRLFRIRQNLDAAARTDLGHVAVKNSVWRLHRVRQHQWQTAAPLSAARRSQLTTSLTATTAQQHKHAPLQHKAWADMSEVWHAVTQTSVT
jgi:hypothetical protein